VRELRVPRRDIRVGAPRNHAFEQLDGAAVLAQPRENICQVRAQKVLNAR
jgi:hypothetical protein